MTIEQSIKNDPAKFQATLESKVPDIQSALNDLSAKLDVIIGGAIKEYCESEQVEADLNSVSSYKAMNKLITGKLDEIIAEHVKVKRADL